ncbi:MAG TPA: DUF222 domain-containing protein, partial [Candidatus Thermoplasmatota archaeon]
GRDIVELSAEIESMKYRLLTMIADFDRRRGWELDGFQTCAHWLAARTGTRLGAAREKVRAARALVGLPEISASMARGELSLSHVRALTRVATPDNEGKLLEKSRGRTVAEVERMARSERVGSLEDEAARERERWERRKLSIFPDGDGMYVVHGVLPPEVGMVVRKAIDAANDALFREQWSRGERDDDLGKAAAQRRADALGLVAERALAAGFGGRVERARSATVESRDGAERPEPATGAPPEGVADGGEAGRSSAASNEGGNTRRGEETAGSSRGSCAVEKCDGTPGVDGAAPTPVPLSGSRAERYQVMLHVDMAALRSDRESRDRSRAAGGALLDDGTRVTHETSRRLTCDCSLVEVVHGPSGEVLNVGRRTRKIPPALRRALHVRDKGCRFPSCGLAFTSTHHVVHWADGGETSLANCLLLCRHHHRLVHEGRWRVGWTPDGRAVFTDPGGGVHVTAKVASAPARR